MSDGPPVQIVARCKPSAEPESAWRVKNGRLKLGSEEDTEGIKPDKILEEGASHSDLFALISDWVRKTLDGDSLLILAYGLACSGKSYTVFGSPGKTRTNPLARGVVVRCMEELVSKLQQKEGGVTVQIRASFYHVSFDGHISDLIDTKKRNLQVEKDAYSEECSVPEATQQPLVSVQDVVRLVEKSLLMRNATGTVRKEARFPAGHYQTSDNPLQEYKPHSSHAVLQYNIQLCIQDKVTTSTLTIVDLAGHSIDLFHTEPSTCEDKGIMSLHNTLTALRYGDIHKATECCLSSPLTQLLYAHLFGKSLVIVINTLVTAGSCSHLSKKALEMCENFRFISQKVSPTPPVSYSSTSLSDKLTRIKESKKQILQELNVSAEYSTVQVINNASVNVNGKVYDQISPVCMEIVKNIKDMESQLLFSAKTTPQNTLSGPKIADKPAPKPTILQLKPPLTPSKPSLSPLKLPSLHTPMPLINPPALPTVNQKTKNSSSSEASSSDSESEKVSSINPNISSPPPLQDIPNILPPTPSNKTQSSLMSPSPNQTLLSNDPIQQNKDISTQLLPPLKLPSNKQLIKSPSVKRDSSSSPSSPSPSRMGNRKKKQKKKKLKSSSSIASSASQKLFRPFANRTIGKDSSSSTSSESDQDTDKFDPNFVPKKLPIQRQMSLPLMRPMNSNIRTLPPYQQFPVLRVNSLPPPILFQPIRYQSEPSAVLPPQQVYNENPPSYEYQSSSVDETRDGPISELSDHVIHLSAMNGASNSQMKTLAMKYGVDHIDSGGRTPLMYSVLGNQLKTLEVLISIGANINAFDSLHHTALLWAVYQGKPEAVKILLKHGANIHITDLQKRSVFHWAMKIPNVTCLKYLCKCTISCNIENQPDIDGLTPFHWAVMCKQSQHINVFLSSLPSVETNCQDTKGRTPLNYAILLFSPTCIKAILDCRPAAASFKDASGRTALHYACAENSIDCVRVLLSYKSYCDIHATDDLGTTPLHWAAASNQPSIIQLLLRRGANIDLVDKQNMTPLDYANKRDHAKCANILKQFARPQRPSSALSTASQYSLHPDDPYELDQFGHVPMKQPLSSNDPDNWFSVSGGSSLSSIARLPADGISITEDVSQEQTSENGDKLELFNNDPLSRNGASTATRNRGWTKRLSQYFCGGCLSSNNVVAPQDAQ